MKLVSCQVHRLQQKEKGAFLTDWRFFESLLQCPFSLLSLETRQKGVKSVIMNMKQVVLVSSFTSKERIAT